LFLLVEFFSSLDLVSVVCDDEVETEADSEAEAEAESRK
jgi:hypothetical protein